MRNNMGRWERLRTQGDVTVDAPIARTLVLVSVALIGLSVVIEGRSFLPAHYRYDSDKIQLVARGMRDVGSDESFRIVGAIYRALGLESLPLVAGAMAYVLFVLALIVGARAGRPEPVRVIEWAIWIGALSLAAIYLGAYSKDIFVVPVALLFMLARKRSIWSEVLPITGILLYAATMRTYWILVLAVYIFFRLLLPRIRSLGMLVLAVILVLAVLAISFPLILGVDLGYHRFAANVFRSGIDSMIVAPIPGGGIAISGLNALIVLAGFVVPVGLILSGDPLLLVVAVFLALVWSMVLRTSWKRMRSKSFDSSSMRILALLIAVTIVQSAFEPDYGSYVRHITPLLPLVIAYLGNDAYSNTTRLNAGTKLKGLNSAKFA